jgi:UDP-N-acetylmuramyl pentapeptide synthase
MLRNDINRLNLKIDSNQEVIEQLDQFLKNDDVVLVKGSHSMNLKEIVEKI